jgi:hypothetical protein
MIQDNLSIFLRQNLRFLAHYFESINSLKNTSIIGGLFSLTSEHLNTVNRINMGSAVPNILSLKS